MTPESTVEEIRARLQLSEGMPTLLLAVAPSNAVLPEALRLLLLVLRATSVDIADLGYMESSTGPARWAEATRARPAGAFAISFIPSNPLSVPAFARILNAERELLRELGGPLVLFVSRDTERDLRRHAPDFFTWVAHGYELPAVRDLEAIAARYAAPDTPVSPAPPREAPIRFLHLSDIHLRPQRVKRFDQDRVLGGLVTFLERDAARFPLDLMFVTGDLAQSGQPEEYSLIEDLLRKLMEVTRVPADRVFVVPGNHDVDREVGRFLLRSPSKEEDAIAFFAEPRSRVFHEQKLTAYKKSMGALLGESRPHGLGVGESAVETVEIRGARIAVAGFNSAWFAQGDDDQGKLWLGEPGVIRALDAVADSEASFAIALLHHPFDYLHEIERDIVERWFERGFDLVLRGHLHTNKTRSIVSQRGGFVEVASPAAYQGSQWPNGCFLGEIRPRARRIFLKPLMYASGPDPWVLDTKVFPDDEADGHCHEFVVPEKKRLPSSTARPLRAAAEISVRTASPAAQTAIARRLESTDLAIPGADSADRTSKTASLLSDSPELLSEVFDNGSSAIALAQRIVDEARKPEWQSRRVSLSDADGLERALAAAGALVLRALPRVQRARLSEVASTSALTAALTALVDAGVFKEPVVGDRLRPDILIGAPDATGWVVEVKRVSQRSERQKLTAGGLARLDSYLHATGARQGALILLGALPASAAEPRIEQARTPSGQTVFVMSL